MKKLITALALFLTTLQVFSQAKKDSLLAAKKIDSAFVLLKEYVSKTQSLGAEFKENLASNELVIGEYTPPYSKNELANFKWNDSSIKSKKYIIVFIQKHSSREMHIEIAQLNQNTRMIICGEDFAKQVSVKIISCSLLGGIIQKYGSSIEEFETITAQNQKKISMSNYLVYLYGNSTKEEEFKAGHNVKLSIPSEDRPWVESLKK